MRGSFVAGVHLNVPPGARVLDLHANVLAPVPGTATWTGLSGRAAAGGVGFLFRGNSLPERAGRAQLIAIGLGMHSYQTSWTGQVPAAGDLRTPLGWPAVDMPFRHLALTVDHDDPATSFWQLQRLGVTFARVAARTPLYLEDGIFPAAAAAAPWTGLQTGAAALLVHMSTMPDVARFGVAMRVRVAPFDPTAGAALDGGRNLEFDNSTITHPQAMRGAGDPDVMPWHSGTRPIFIERDQALVVEAINNADSLVAPPARLVARALVAVWDEEGR